MQGGEKQGKVTKLSKNEVLMLNIGSMCTGARVIAVSFSCFLPFAAFLLRNLAVGGSFSRFIGFES